MPKKPFLAAARDGYRTYNDYGSNMESRGYVCQISDISFQKTHNDVTKRN